jgi:hypothetical protein
MDQDKYTVENPFEAPHAATEAIETGAEVTEALTEGTEVAEVAGEIGEAAGPAGLVLEAGAAGFEIGTALDQKFGISDAISDETSGVNAVMAKNGLHTMKKGSAEDLQRQQIEARLGIHQHYAH